MKLTDVQRKVVNKIKEDLILAKECKSLKEYCIKASCQGDENSMHYSEYLQEAEKRFERNPDYFIDIYAKWWKAGREQNIILVWTSSSTLRALEKKGIIEIIEDGKNFPDTVKLLVWEVD